MKQAGDLQLSYGPRVGPGKLITIDGLDGSGKTTLTESLRQQLCRLGIETVITRFPTTELRESKFFELLQRRRRTDLIDPLAFEVEYMVDRIQHCRTFIEPLLRRGAVVITDRYALSSIGSLLLHLPELREVAIRALTSEAWFKDLSRYLIQPDLSFLVHAEMTACAARLNARAEEAGLVVDLDAYAALQKLLFDVAEVNGMIPVYTGSSRELSLKTCMAHVQRLFARPAQEHVR